MPQGPNAPQCLVITGPTACGKTDLALELAAEFPIEIISMDSAMVYRGMDIGTAKPDAGTRNRVMHHLVDIRDPEENYSAGSFAADTLRLIAGINARGKFALIVGGTMLYLKALRDGIADLPDRDPQVRAAIEARAAEQGWPALHAELARVDARAAARIEPTDRQRIQRALEVWELTGSSLSQLQRQASQPGLDVAAVALVPRDRTRLAATIASRFDRMLGHGLIDEVRRLHERPGLSADCTSMRAVGYRQLWAWLDGEYALEEARERAIIATRQLAKRQLTWLRSDLKSEKLAVGDSRNPDLLRERITGSLDSA